MQVVIGGDDPQASTAKVAGDVFYYFDQRGTDAKSGLNTIQGHDFAVIVLDVIGNQSHRLAIADGNKSREVMRVVDYAVSDNVAGSPVFGDELPDPIFITGIEWPDRKICHVLTPDTVADLARRYR